MSTMSEYREIGSERAEKEQVTVTKVGMARCMVNLWRGMPW